MSETTASNEPDTKEQSPKPSTHREKQSPSSGMVFILLAVSVFSAYSAFNANKAVDAAALSVEKLRASYSALEQTTRDVKQAQERLAMPGRHEFIVQIPTGAKECRIRFEQNDLSKYYQQQVDCR